MAERLVFTHMGKAGGSTINGALYLVMANCGASTLAFSGASSTYGNSTLPLKLLRRYGLEASDFPIVTGHLPFATAWRCFAPATFVTVLREPADMLLSSYCSQPWNRDKADFGLGRFTWRVKYRWRIEPRFRTQTEWCIDNYQTRMLCDDPRFGRPSTREMLEQAKQNLDSIYAVVGFQDRLSAFLEALGNLYGVDLTCCAEQMVNATGSYRRFVTDRHLDVARRHSPLDVELYNWARDRFQVCRAERRLGAPVANATFRKYAVGPDRFELAC